MSLLFNGSTDVVTGAPTTLGTSVTFAAWVYPASMGELDTGVVIKQGAATGGNPGRLILWYNGTASSNKLRFANNRATDGQWDFDTTIALSTWTHVAVTYDGR